jgi:hypothetical protein
MSAVDDRSSESKKPAGEKSSVDDESHFWLGFQLIYRSNSAEIGWIAKSGPCRIHRFLEKKWSIFADFWNLTINAKMRQSADICVTAENIDSCWDTCIINTARWRVVWAVYILQLYAMSSWCLPYLHRVSLLVRYISFSSLLLALGDVYAILCWPGFKLRETGHVLAWSLREDDNVM